MMVEKKTTKSEKSEKPAEISEPKKRVAAKIFDDVKRPENVSATPTSKPVIVGHGSIIKDPMVSPLEENSAEETKVEAKIIDKPKTELKLEPITLTQEIASETETETSEEPNKTAEEPATTEENKASQTEQNSSSSAAVDAIVDNINTKKERNEEAEKQQIIDNEVNDLINSRQYNVKIRSAPNKRKIRSLLALLVLLLLAGAGWYLGIGPGKDLWLKEHQSAVKNTVETITPSQATSKQTTSAVKAPELIAFTNASINLTFSYPKTWKVDVNKPENTPKFDQIVLSGANQQVSIKAKDGSSLQAEAFLRTTILVENTKDSFVNKSDLTKLVGCESEDLLVGNINLKLIFSSLISASPNVSKVSLSPALCLPNAKLFDVNDQVQLSTKQNTYKIFSEYILSTAYLEKNGIKDKAGIAQAQSSGALTAKDAFKTPSNYAQFTDMLKTLKEL